MNSHTLKTRLKALDLRKKLILLGSVAAVIAVFLPWYRDIDRFNTGDVFLGVTGPLYLAGIIVFLAGVASLGLIMLELFEKPKPKLPLSESNFHIFGAALSVLMLVLTNSVYFHNKFGINLVNKSMGIGMILAIVGVGLLLLGGILLAKNRPINFDTEGKIEPLIDMNIKERTQNAIKEEPRTTVEHGHYQQDERHHQGDLIGKNDPLQKLLNPDLEDEHRQ